MSAQIRVEDMVFQNTANTCNEIIDALQTKAKMEAIVSGSGVETEFRAMLPEIMARIVENKDHGDMGETNAWLADVMEYNMPTGPISMGLTVVNTVRHLMPDADEEMLNKAAVLGWCVEMVSKAHRVKADIVEERTTSHGKPSWHLARGLGIIGFNDTMLLNGSMYFLLQHYFADHPRYTRLLNHTHEAQMHKSFGHTLSSKTRSLECSGFRHLNLRRYEAIVKYKTGYFSFYFPVAVALTFCGWKYDSEALLDILCKIGLLSEMVKDRKPTGETLNWHLFAALQKGPTAEECKMLGKYASSGSEKGAMLAAELYERFELDEVLSTSILDLYVEICKDLVDADQSGSAKYPVGIVRQILASVFL